MPDSMKVKSDRPLRLALLGESKVGKSAFIQCLTLRNFVETYYPTLNSTPMLIEWTAKNAMANMILNEYADMTQMGPVINNDRIMLSPYILAAVNDMTLPVHAGKTNARHHRRSSTKRTKKIKKNQIYTIAFNDGVDSAIGTDNGAVAFHISPILLELIDTPPFNPDQVVPFLEASLDIKLPPEILHNLANEPRRDHSAKPLIVASGAHDMNGNIDGYFFVYSAIPSLNPPGYDEEDPGVTTSEERSPLALLKEMKLILDEAWKEYTSYKRGWEIGGEGDVFSFVYSVKSLWKKQAITNADKTINVEEYYKPPILIVCTHCDSEAKAPNLIREGRDLAKSWNCGFIEMDNLNIEETEIATSLLIRDIVEQNSARNK